VAWLRCMGSPVAAAPVALRGRPSSELRRALAEVPLLQDGTDLPSVGHYLASTPETVLWGRLPCGADHPVLSVDDGSTVTVDTVSHEGVLEDQGRDPVAWFAGKGVPADAVLRDAIGIAASAVPHDADADGPHVVTGPIAVAGALPGDVLAVTVEQLRPRAPYGTVSSRHGRGALPGELPEGDDPVCVFATAHPGPDGWTGRIAVDSSDEDAGSLVFPLRPFLGLVGVAVAGDDRPHSVPPGAHGGNLDVSLLGVGSTLYLPVQVPDALLYVGDPHFAQGDGEVALTAFEAPLRATLRLDVVPAARVAGLLGAQSGPVGETPELLVPIGLDVDLGEAMRQCVRSALSLLQGRFGLSRAVAYAYLSAAGDFAVSQVVDRVSGVHAALRKADFVELRPPSGPPSGRP